jgi:hypothetical protein
MAFKVHHAAGYDSFGDGVTYNFNEAGLLVLHLGPDGGRLTFSPHAWTVVEEPDRNGEFYRQRGRFSRE